MTEDKPLIISLLEAWKCKEEMITPVYFCIIRIISFSELSDQSWQAIKFYIFIQIVFTIRFSDKPIISLTARRVEKIKNDEWECGEWIIYFRFRLEIWEEMKILFAVSLGEIEKVTSETQKHQSITALVFVNTDGKNRSNWGKAFILYSFLTRSLDDHFGLSFCFLAHFIGIKVHPRYALYYQQNLAEIVKGLLWIRSTLSIIAFFFFFFFFWVIEYWRRQVICKWFSNT